MPVPEQNLNISDISVIGSPLGEDYFPRVLDRRISTDANDSDCVFDKVAAEHLDYSIDMYHLLEKNEYVIGAYAWSNAPDDLEVTMVFFSQKGVVVFVANGTDTCEYEISVHVKTTYTETRIFTFKVLVSGDATQAIATYLPPDLLTQNDPDYWFFTDMQGRYLGPPFVDAVGTFLNGETLNMDFINEIYLSKGRSLTFAEIVTYTRATVANDFGVTGSLDVVPIDTPPKTFDPILLTAKGFRFEGTAENSFEDNQTPVTQTLAVTAEPYTLSFFGDGTITLSDAHVAVVVGAGVFPARTVLTFTPTAGNLTLTLSGTVSDPQIEKGSYASTPIDTPVADSATRAAASALITGNNFYDWHSHIANTYVLKAQTPAVGIHTIYREDNGGSDELVYIYTEGTDLKVQVVAAATIQFTQIIGTIVADTEFTLAMRLAGNDFAASLDGAAVVSFSTVVLPLLNQALFGTDCIISAISVAQARLANTELQARSAP